MSIRVVRDLEIDCWREFVDKHPQGNIFHTPEIFQVFANAKGHHPALWATVDSEQQVWALLLPVEITQIGFLRPLTTRAVVYGSVLYNPGPEGERALDLLLRTYRHETGRNILYTELRNLSDQSQIQPLLANIGFSYEDHLDYLIDLKRPVDAIFQSIGQRTRKNIRRGLNRGEVVIEEVRDREQLASCYQLLKNTYQAAGVPLADRSLFESAFDRLSPKGMVKFTQAKVSQVPVAVSIELFYKDTIYGWYGGLDRGYSAFTPNELLMWHILRQGAENGYGLYDFGGAGKPDQRYGVRDFKAKFGGSLVCFGRNTVIHSPLVMRLTMLGYRVQAGLMKLAVKTFPRKEPADNSLPKTMDIDERNEVKIQAKL